MKKYQSALALLMDPNILMGFIYCNYWKTCNPIVRFHLVFKMLHSAPSVGRFAHCKIVSAYCSLLRRYATNSTLTNHCVIKMLHRVAWDCKMPAMLFQLSLFKTFQMIMNDPRAKIDPTVKVRKLMNRCRTFLLVQAIICLTLPGRN